MANTANSTPVNNITSNYTDNGAGSKHSKVRSHSHSFSKPLNTTNGSSNNGTGNRNGSVGAPGFLPEEENVGFIPKIIVRSRRSSFIHPSSVPSAAQQAPSHLPSAFNTTLNTTKSRKNSFTGRSRRSSFSLSGSATPSRRSSLIMAPNSLSGMFGNNTSSSTPKLVRRDSIVKKEFYTHRSASASPSFMDLPPAAIPPPANRRLSRTHPKQQLSHHQHSLGSPPVESVSRNNTSVAHGECARWSSDEDQLLSENSSRNLSLMELSILLPNRSEQEIQWRLDTMFSEKSPITSNEASHSPLNSPRKSITPEDTAIDEDTCDERDQADEGDDDEMDNMSIERANNDSNDSPSFNSKEGTPASIISSTTTKDDNLSDSQVPSTRSHRSTDRAENSAPFDCHAQNASSKFSPQLQGGYTSIHNILHDYKG
ncbi:uncharacterized protein ZBAI_08773 [Zygosaccharomyces bailii ISA1307]|nr:uncharacterized protein ZBAI_08773 [Zygosaccharomyces bailii ISA1307]